jgi:hypothetical protein
MTSDSPKKLTKFKFQLGHWPCQNDFSGSLNPLKLLYHNFAYKIFFKGNYQISWKILARALTISHGISHTIPLNKKKLGNSKIHFWGALTLPKRFKWGQWPCWNRFCGVIDPHFAWNFWSVSQFRKNVSKIMVVSARSMTPPKRFQRVQWLHWNYHNFRNLNIVDFFGKYEVICKTALRP